MHHSNKLATTLTTLLCASLTATALIAVPADGATTATHAGRTARASRKHHAKASCAARAAAAVRAHEAVRPCHTSTQKHSHAHHTTTPRAPRAHHAKPHKTSTPGSLETPSGETAAATNSQANPQQTAATIASVLATPCQNTEATPEAGNLPVIRAAVLCLINQERAAHGIAPLAANPELEQAAEGHTQELVQDDYFAHISPSGVTPVDRIRETGYIPGPSVGYVIGENLAWGTYSLATPHAIVDAWIASPGHLANILESQYRETGIGITSAVPVSLGEGEPGATYAQEFGVIIH